MVRPTAVTASRTAGMAEAAAVLVDDPAVRAVGKRRVRPSALMKRADALYASYAAVLPVKPSGGVVGRSPGGPLPHSSPWAAASSAGVIDVPFGSSALVTEENCPDARSRWTAVARTVGSSQMLAGSRNSTLVGSDSARGQALLTAHY